MRKLFAIAVLCLIAVPVQARPADSLRDFREIRSRIRDTIIRAMRTLVPHEDNLNPPRP